MAISELVKGSVNGIDIFVDAGLREWHIGQHGAQAANRVSGGGLSGDEPRGPARNDLPDGAVKGSVNGNAILLDTGRRGWHIGRHGAQAANRVSGGGLSGDEPRGPVRNDLPNGAGLPPVSANAGGSLH